MRVEAVGSAMYVPFVPDIGNNTYIITELQRLARIEERKREHIKKIRSRFPGEMNKLAKEYDRAVMYYDNKGFGHGYEYYNFSWSA